MGKMGNQFSVISYQLSVFSYRRTRRSRNGCGKGGKDGKNVKERGGGEGCDGSRSIGETRGGADGVGTLVTVRGRC